MIARKTLHGGRDASSIRRAVAPTSNYTAANNDGSGGTDSTRPQTRVAATAE
jgi:hypothetical protein